MLTKPKILQQQYQSQLQANLCNLLISADISTNYTCLVTYNSILQFTIYLIFRAAGFGKRSFPVSLFSFPSTYLSTLLRGQWADSRKWNISNRCDVLTTVRLIFRSCGMWHCRCDSGKCHKIWAFIWSNFISKFTVTFLRSCVNALITHSKRYNIRPQLTGRKSAILLLPK
jgi:hypothetical protein